MAPILNTIPSQTRAHENHLLIAMEQQLQQQIAAQQIQIMQQQQEIEAARHFGRLWAYSTILLYKSGLKSEKKCNKY